MPYNYRDTIEGMCVDQDMGVRVKRKEGLPAFWGTGDELVGTKSCIYKLMHMIVNTKDFMQLVFEL